MGQHHSRAAIPQMRCDRTTLNPRNRSKNIQTPNPISKTNQNHIISDLFSTRSNSPSLNRDHQSQSPIMNLAPWRFNRRRIKRPIYPRFANDPVKARKAVLRLSDENLCPTAAFGKSNISHSNQKMVRFLDNHNSFYVRSRNPMDNEQEFYENNRPKSSSHILQMKTLPGIIPLGMYQYSAYFNSSVSPRPLLQDNGQNTITIPKNLVYEKGSGIVIHEKEPCPVRPSHDDGGEATLSSQDLQDDFLSRLLIQLACRLNIDTDQLQNEITKEQLPHLIETILLEKLGSGQLAPVSSPVLRPPTPLLLPDLSTKHSKANENLDDHLAIPSPTFNVESPALTLTNSPIMKTNEEGVSHGGKYSIRVPYLEIPQTPSPRLSLRSHSTAVSTPISLPKSSLHIRSHSSDPVRSSKSSNFFRSPVPTPVQLLHSYPNLHSTCLPKLSMGDLEEKTFETDPTRTPSFSTHEAAFSLTAPNTFSEGIWLMDRSEGELGLGSLGSLGANQVQGQNEFKSDNMNHDEHLYDLYEMNTPTSVQSPRKSSSNGDLSSHLDKDASHLISVGQFPQNLGSRISIESGQTRCRTNPLHDPLLHLLTLQLAGNLNIRKLKTEDKKRINKLVTKLKQHCAKTRLGGLLDQSQSQTFRKPLNLDWLANLSGSTNASRLDQSQSGRQTKYPIAKQSYSDCSTSNWLEKLIPTNYNNMVGSNLVNPNIENRSKLSMLGQVELVHSDTSDTETLENVENFVMDDDDEQEQLEGNKLSISLMNGTALVN